MPIPSTLAHALRQSQLNPRQPMLHMPESVFRQLRSHGEATYPHECCGILIGTTSGPHKSVNQAVAFENASPSDTHRRYEIAPLDLLRAERAARATGQEIVGFYHSHPDHPAKPSSTDLVEAHWLGCSYVITEIRNASAAVTRSFHLAGCSEEGKHFEAEEIRVVSTPELPPNRDDRS